MKKKAGPRSGQQARISAERKRYILMFYEAGLPLKSIALKFGVSESYPCQLAAREGVKRQSPGDDEQVELLHKALAETVVDSMPAPEFPVPTVALVEKPPANGGLAGTDLIKPAVIKRRPRLVERKRDLVSHPISSAEEIRRLFARGVGRTGIAAILRCTYREIDVALAKR